MDEVEFKLLNSVNQITRPEWDRIFGDIPESYAFYKSLEESKLEEFSFYYAVLYKDKRIFLIAPLFIADFNLDIAVEGWLEKFIVGIRKIIPRFLILKTLFCGAPFSEHGIIGLSCEAEQEKEVAWELLKGLGEFSRKKKINFYIFKDFPEEQADFLSPLLENGFFRLNSFPVALNELNFNTLEDYIKSLGSSTRKNLRRKLKEAYTQARITVSVVERVDHVIDDICRLYSNTFTQGTTRFEKLTKEFFLSVGKNMQPNVKFFLYYVNEKLAAFNLCFVYQDLCIDKFIGFDYDMSNRNHLYFVSWCNNIEWCIKNSVRFYKTGQTDYYAKVRMGSRLVPLYVYLKHKNKLITLFLKILSLVLKPDNYDKAAKEN